MTYVQRMARALRLVVESVEKTTGDDAQILCTTLSAGERITVRLIGCIEPDIIWLTGRDAQGNMVNTFQNAGQVDLLIKTVPWNPQEQPQKNRIGFRLGDSETGGLASHPQR